MRALLLAGGYGTRLRPLTNTVPKCLVSIKGKPLLDIWLERLSEAGIGPFLINTHYLAEKVVRHVERSPFRDQINLVHEPVLLGTAGTLIANAGFFGGEDGLLIHADNYCLADFREFIQVHKQRPSECLMTMMAFRTETPTSCGIVELDGRGVVVGFHEKVIDPPGNLANGAIYAISREMMDRLKMQYGDITDFSTEILPEFVGRICSCETIETFLDIGTPEMYAKSQCGG